MIDSKRALRGVLAFGLVLSLLAIGTCLNGLMVLPYALQLAYGWTRLALYINLVAVAVLAPLIYFLAIHFGAPGIVGTRTRSGFGNPRVRSGASPMIST